MPQFKMAYLMHIDWNWIKQRPHFLAEELSRSVDLDLYFIRNLKVKGLVKNIISDKFKNTSVIKKVPFSARSKALNKFECLVNRKPLRKFYSQDYQYIWITSPIVLQFFEIHRTKKSSIIYDCMDDVLEFPQSEKNKLFVWNLEQKLLSIADFVFVSSSQLRKKIEERGYKGQIYLINNAIDPSLVTVKSTTEKSNPKREDQLYNICYFGTISSWFDFDLILRLLEEHKDIRFTLIGPSEVQIPNNTRIDYLGPKTHSELKKYAESANAFIMPFKLNDLILSVDPVKVYEYIAFLKASFIINYEETQKFKEFVILYNDFDQLSKLIQEWKFKKDYLPDLHKVNSFIQQNTWSERVEKISEILRLNYESE